MESRQRTEDPGMDRRTKNNKNFNERREPQYHVYIRLPFNRGDFVDPGTVNWDEKKSEALWGILFDSPLDNVDWAKLAGQFDVPVDFLLQMVSYLTDRHHSQVRAHVLKAAAARGSNAASPVPGAEPSTSHPPSTDATRRFSSGTARAPSALSMRKETATPIAKNEEAHSAAGDVGPSSKNTLPARPESSRNSSSNTAVPSQNQQNQLGSRPGTGSRLSDPQRRRFSHLSAQHQQQYQPPDDDDTEIPPPSPARSTSPSSPDSDSDSDSPVESRIIRRPPRFNQPKDSRTGPGGSRAGPYGDDDDDDDDDAEPAFLPYKHQAGSSAQGTGTGGSSSGQDLTATLRGNMRDLTIAAAAGRRQSGNHSQSQSQSQTSDSSIGSTSVVPGRRPVTAGAGAGAGADLRRVPTAGAGGASLQGPLSPRRTAELAARGKGASREGSDGAPSMGSSFSDLDDASVTQSALEEALASRMQDGTIGSRMSVIGGTIGQAFRSRYLPKPNRQ